MADERESTYPLLLRLSFFLLWSSEHHFFALIIPPETEVANKRAKSFAESEVNYSRERELDLNFDGASEFNDRLRCPCFLLFG